MDIFEPGIVDSKIDFRPRRISSDYLLVEENHQTKSIWACLRINEILTPEDLNNYFVDILKYCLTHRIDAYRIHVDRKRGAKLIKKVARRTNYNDLALTQVVGIIWSSLSVAHHFYIRMLPNAGYKTWIRRRQFRLAFHAYEKVLLMLLPHLFTTVVNSVITFFNEAKIWDLETLVTILIKKILEIYKDNDALVDNLLDIAMSCKEAMGTTKILRVVCNLFDQIEWKGMDNALLARFIEQYRQSMVDDGPEMLKSSYEACLRHILPRLPRQYSLTAIHEILGWTDAMPLSSLYSLGDLLEYTAGLYDQQLEYSVSITRPVLEQLLDTMTNDNVYLSLLASRLLFLMLDRSKNDMLTTTRDAEVELKIAKYNALDKRFLQEHHNIFQPKLLGALMKHGTSRVNLECIFAIIGAIVVEVPCGYTAATTVCLAMAIQEYCFEAFGTMELEKTSHIHACVMGVMSLICCVHNAKVFYDYVDTIMWRRAYYAPQLNPPLKSTFADDNTYLKKPELYFEDWEARFGLWKCFKI